MHLWFPADDDNLIILDPIPGQEDCQSDYINACYVDVSVCDLFSTIFIMLPSNAGTLSSAGFCQAKEVHCFSRYQFHKFH